MISKIQSKFIQNQFWVIIFIITIFILSLRAFHLISIDAVPDISPVQVQINTRTGSLDPEQVEKTVTFKIENEMAGLPNVKDIRSISKYGFCQVVVTFKDNMNLYFARQLVSEKLLDLMGDLPNNLSPELGVNTTGLGEVMFYVLLAKQGSPLSKKTEYEQAMYLRTIQDFTVKPYIKSHAEGVVEVDTDGGFKKEIHIDFHPRALEVFGITLDEMIKKIDEVGENFGGGYIEKNKEQVIVRTHGQLDLKQIEMLPVKLGGTGRAVRVKDVATVRVDNSVRLGAGMYFGKETVMGTPNMLAGENSAKVTDNIEKALKELELPSDVELKILYTRKHLVNKTLQIVAKNLSEGAFLVILVLFLIMGKFRAALLVSLAIPLSMMMSLILMEQYKISANLMSLGAIDFGLLVDGAVVVVENLIRKLESFPNKKFNLKQKIELVLDSAKEVNQPIILGLVIVMLVYVPVLSLEGVEGKMFFPMALTVLIALYSSLLVAIFLMPVLSLIFLFGKEHDNFKNFFNKYFNLNKIFINLKSSNKSKKINITNQTTLKKNLNLNIKKENAHNSKSYFTKVENFYEKILNYTLSDNLFVKNILITSAILFALLSYIIFTRLGADFMPPLDEGNMTIIFSHPSNISLSETLRLEKEYERIISKFSEVKYIVSRAGTAEALTDPAGVNIVDCYVLLKEHDEWPKINNKRRTKTELFLAIEKEIKEHIAKNEKLDNKLDEVKHSKKLSNENLDEDKSNDFHMIQSQPIAMVFNDMLEGSRADVSLRIYGKDLNYLLILQNKAIEIIKKIKGADRVVFDEITALRSGPILDLKLQYDKMNSYGVTLKDVSNTLKIAMAGQEIGSFYDYDIRFPIIVKMSEEYRNNYDEISHIPVPLDNSGNIPFGKLAKLQNIKSVVSIARAQGKRYAGLAVYLDENRDSVSFVKEARVKLKKELNLPEGYNAVWGGKFKNLEAAKNKFFVVVPIILIIILLLLFKNFGNLRQSLLVYISIPFAMTGGVWAIFLRNINFSVSAAVGFITLMGIATLNSMVMITFINQLRNEKKLNLKEAVKLGALTRLRPIIMTALVAMFGFIPMALNTGLGAEVQRPLATVVIGGLITATMLTLLLIPMLYYYTEKRIK